MPLSPELIAARLKQAPTWVLYGYIQLPALNRLGVGDTRKAIHKDDLPSEAVARKEAVVAVLQGGVVVGVIVRLDHGVDVNGQRHVIHRLNGGKAWWE